MSWERWDEEIVLWAGGDAVSEPFLAHLPGCRRCRRELAAMETARAEWADWLPRRRFRYWSGAAGTFEEACFAAGNCRYDEDPDGRPGRRQFVPGRWGIKTLYLLCFAMVL